MKEMICSADARRLETIMKEKRSSFAGTGMILLQPRDIEVEMIHILFHVPSLMSESALAWVALAQAATQMRS
jgi:hypothetical protein